jgi:2-dehydro-3-deoxyphosphooctonate aldolase (KDO 8-P synthase)
MTTFSACDVRFGAGDLVVIAGPCLAESRDLCEEVGGRMKELCAELGFPYVFKASFDKANRTGAASARRPEEDGLATLAHMRSTLGVPTTTDIHLPEQACEAAQVVDLLQIPAFLCRQTDLLDAAARTGLPVNVKKGQFLAPWDARHIVEKLRAMHASGIMLTERGTTFGYNALIVDFPGLETMRGFGVPVCFDATHAAQRPGGLGAVSGGAREAIPAMTRAAVAVGIDAIFLEVHPKPEQALSDAATQWPLDQARELLEPLAALSRSRQRKFGDH